jgi:hypothetical protein
MKARRVFLLFLHYLQNDSKSSIHHPEAAVLRRQAKWVAERNRISASVAVKIHPTSEPDRILRQQCPAESPSRPTSGELPPLL